MAVREENEKFCCREITAWWLALLSLSAVAFSFGACCLAFYYGFAQNLEPAKLDSWAKLGAGLSPVASLLSFLVLAISLFITATNFTRQQKQTGKHFAEQQFENQLFQLIRNWRDAVANVECEVCSKSTAGDSEDAPIIYTGANALKIILVRLKKLIVPPETWGGAVSDEMINSRRKVITEIFDSVCKEYKADIGHCYRMLYHIVRLIDENDMLNAEEKRKLIGIVRSHLSETEFALLFYNCITERGYYKMRRLVDHYDLLQNITESSIDSIQDWKFYPLTKDRWITSE